MTDLASRLQRAGAMLGPLAVANYSLAGLCTYKVGGAASYHVVVDSLADLQRLSEAVRINDVPTLVVGKGSNLLVSDAGFVGVSVQLGESFTVVAIDPDSGAVGLGAGVLLPIAARRTAAAGLTGFEWAVGVPGSVGGAVRMNAGGHGSDMAATLRCVQIFDLGMGQQTEWSADDLGLGYRRSALGPGQLVLAAELQLERGEVAASEAEISDIVRWRRENQPGGQNAGSVFTNPPDDSAGRLIDAAGLKGFRVGTAVVSSKHANFIQADPDGSADDVHRLIVEIRRRVAQRFGVVLHCENKLIGFTPLAEDPMAEQAVGEDPPTRPAVPRNVGGR